MRERLNSDVHLKGSGSASFNLISHAFPHVILYILVVSVPT